MAAYRFVESARGTVGGDGTAVATIGPSRSFETWRVDSVTVQSTSVTLVPQARVYQNFIAETTLLGGSHTGNLDTAQTDGTILRAPDKLIVVWSGADIGSECVVTVAGSSVRQ